VPANQKTGAQSVPQAVTTHAEISQSTSTSAYHAYTYYIH